MCEADDVEPLVEHHRRACAGFSAVADAVPGDAWGAPTPCSEWDARALVEHIIGFHEVLLLRLRGIKAHRPREGPAERWRATSDAMVAALEADEPVLAALTNDVLVHTWDLGTAIGLESALDPALVTAAVASVHGVELDRTSGMFDAEVPVADDADAVAKLVAFYGRDPSWTP
jgi:uncharacterized protein (TIGR03083 family)